MCSTRIQIHLMDCGLMICIEQVRDYIHVMDLADGHIAALRKIFNTKDIGDL